MFQSDSLLLFGGEICESLRRHWIRKHLTCSSGFTNWSFRKWQLPELPHEKWCIQVWSFHMSFGRNLTAQGIPHNYGMRMMLVYFMQPISPILQKSGLVFHPQTWDTSFHELRSRQVHNSAHVLVISTIIHTLPGCWKKNTIELVNPHWQCFTFFVDFTGSNRLEYFSQKSELRKKEVEMGEK